MRTCRRKLLLLLSVWSVPVILVAQQPAGVQIAGKGIQSVQITEADLKKMARLSVDVQNPHTTAAEHYEGVRVSDLLARAGMPLGEKLRGRSLQPTLWFRHATVMPWCYQLRRSIPA